MISLRRIILLILCFTVFQVCALAQTQPSGLSVSPGTIYKPLGTPHCYTMYVPNGANMTLDVRYKLGTAPDEFIYGWPTLDASGTAYICVDSATSVGTYTFTGVRNALTPDQPFVPVSASVAVQAEPPQATGLTFTTGTQGYAGIDSYTLHAANTGMTVEVEYTINCTENCQTHSTTITLNASGNYTHTLVHDQVTGIYRFQRVRNINREDWIGVSTTYIVKPPKPTSLSISPASVIAGHGSYVMTVGNGKNIYLDARYRFTPPGGTEGVETALEFPFWLNPADSYSSTGVAAVFPGACNTPAGIYRYTWINNRDLALPPYNDTTGTPVNASVTITPPQAPTFSYADPSSGLPGQTNVEVTIIGGNFCGPSLSTSYPGLNVNASPPIILGPNALKARFTIAPTAPAGSATVLITTPSGTVSFTFTIAAPAPPSVTNISPASASAGSSVQVTMTGSNLAGAALSTNYAGLSIGNVSTSNTSLSAMFTLSESAAPGTATINVTTLTPPPATVAFGITASGGASTGPASTKEYVHFGGRVVAVETFALSTEPPNPPQQLTAQALNPTTVQLQWQAATAGLNKTITGYQVKRGGVVIATIAASQLSYLDTSAAQGTTYTFTAVARDNTIPVPLVSANSNAVTTSTPSETIPPTAPANVTLGCEPVEWYWGCEATWTPSTDSGGSGLLGYLVVLYANEYGFYNLDGPTPFNSIGFYTSSLDRLYVYAIDNAGNISAPGIWQP
jgi:hypothetical protein